MRVANPSQQTGETIATKSNNSGKTAHSNPRVVTPEAAADALIAAGVIAAPTIPDTTGTTPEAIALALGGLGAGLRDWRAR